MSISKVVFCVFLSALLILCTFIQDVEAKDIGYPALRPGTSPGCSPKNPNGCIKPPANPYQRGCSPITRCRGNPPPK